MESTRITEVQAELDQVETLRQQRQADPALAARVHALKAFQSERFRDTYADLLGSDRYGPPARFFMTDLYGPTEFAARDAQFARVAPSLMRMFPSLMQDLMADLSTLHGLSERLDTAMAQQLTAPEVDVASYLAAWHRCGERESRFRQIELTLALGHALEDLTRHRWLRNTLRLMRGPARAANLGDLQQVLEAGFDAFSHMRGASDFLATIERRETALMQALFENPPRWPARLD